MTTTRTKIFFFLFAATISTVRAVTVTEVGTTGVFDASGLNEIDIDPTGKLSSFKSAVSTAHSNDLGGVIDWATGVLPSPLDNSGTAAANYLGESPEYNIRVPYGSTSNQTLTISFDRSVGLYNNNVANQVSGLSNSNEIIADGGNDPIGLAFEMAFSGAEVSEIGFAMLARSTFGASGVNFRATATFSDSTTSVINYTCNSGASDTFLHFAAPSGETISSLFVTWISDIQSGLANGQRRPVMDDFGFIVKPPSSPTHHHIYLLGGQSNGNGRADASKLTAPLNAPQADVLLYYLNDQDENSVLPEEQWIDLAPGSGHGTTAYYDTEFGPEVSFGRVMADAKPTENIAIIKYTYGGSNLQSDWSATGARYATFVSTVQAALTALTAAGDTYELSGMLWQQGESDTSGTAADNYETNLANLISRVRTDLNGGTAFPFVIGSLSDSQYSDIATVGSGPYKVRQAQEAVAASDSTVAIVITDGFGIQSDGIHFDYNGQVDLGEGHATQMLLLEGPDETAPLLVSKTPEGQSSDPVSANLVANFNEPIALNEGGTVTLRNLGPGPDIVFTLLDSQVSVSGSQLIINPSSDVIADNPYAIRISSDAVSDLSDNPYAGIADDTTWAFRLGVSSPVNLIHHWTFDADMNDAVGTHHGTASGDASLTTGSGGKFGEALTLDGDGDACDIGQSSLPATNFSMTAWIYRETAGDYMYVAGTQNSGTDGAFMRAEPALGAATANNAFFANLLPPAASQRAWGGTIPLNQWTHVAMTVSSTAGLTLYMNGTPVATDPSATSHDVWSNFRIGARPDVNANYFDGFIDDVAIFDGVLTDVQLSNVMNSGAVNFDKPSPSSGTLIFFL